MSASKQQVKESGQWAVGSKQSTHKNRSGGYCSRLDRGLGVQCAAKDWWGSRGVL